MTSHLLALVLLCVRLRIFTYIICLTFSFLFNRPYYCQNTQIQMSGTSTGIIHLLLV